MSSEVSEAPKRVGRPPRIDREAIARAVVEIGFDDATMKRVAEHLGVSVPGLYYYVRGRDDLLRVAAEYSLARTTLPEDRGQHWATWLREWADYMRGAMAEPELMERYIAGELNDDRVVDVIGQVLDVLARDGFTPEAALAAWEAISSLALGSAVNDMRQRRSVEAGRPWVAQMHASLAQRDDDEHPTLRALLAAGSMQDADAAFAARVTTVLVGTAVREGLPLDDEVLGERPAPSRGRRRSAR